MIYVISQNEDGETNVWPFPDRAAWLTSLKKEEPGYLAELAESRRSPSYAGSSPAGPTRS